MESLQNEYGFTNEQMNGIKLTITNILEPLLKSLVESITPSIIENYKKTLRNEETEIREIKEKRNKAFVFFGK